MRVRTRKIVLTVCTVLALLTSAVWWWSYHESIGMFALPFDTDVRIHRGVIYWRHTYECSLESIPADAWRRAPIPAARFVSSPPTRPFFRFSSGHEMGHVLPSGRIQPVKYWLLLTPLWFFLLVFAAYPTLFLLLMPIRRCREREKRRYDPPVS